MYRTRWSRCTGLSARHAKCTTTAGQDGSRGCFRRRQRAAALEGAAGQTGWNWNGHARAGLLGNQCDAGSGQSGYNLEQVGWWRRRYDGCQGRETSRRTGLVGLLAPGKAGEPTMRLMRSARLRDWNPALREALGKKGRRGSLGDRAGGWMGYRGCCVSSWRGREGRTGWRLEAGSNGEGMGREGDWSRAMGSGGHLVGAGEGRRGRGGYLGYRAVPR